MTVQLTVLGMTGGADRLAFHATAPGRPPHAPGGSAHGFEVAASVLAV